VIALALTLALFSVPGAGTQPIKHRKTSAN